MMLHFADLGTIRVYDPQIFFSTNQTPTITRTGGAAVYGANELIADVNGLHAHGGGDCPEYGMIGILQAISSIQSVQGLVIPQQGNLHHIIVLTDASAKDDSNYTTVISAAAAARVTVHFFYSDSGCGSTMFGHYEDVRIASGGIKVTNFADFDAFGTFIQLYNEAVAAGSTSSKRKRQSSTGDIFSIYSTCHNFNTSLFTPSLALLVRTSQPSVTITRPDGTTHSLTVGGDLGLFQESNPIAGMWTACASPGTLQVAVNAPIVIELEVSFTKKTESGEILPTSEIPSACELARSLFLQHTHTHTHAHMNKVTHLRFILHCRYNWSCFCKDPSASTHLTQSHCLFRVC